MVSAMRHTGRLPAGLDNPYTGGAGGHSGDNTVHITISQVIVVNAALSGPTLLPFQLPLVPGEGPH